MNYNICLIGAKDTTIKLASKLIDNGYSIDLIITVDANTICTDAISGYASPADFANKHGIRLFAVSDYSMRDAASQAFFAKNDFGIGICMGWQRLIPREVLSRFQSGIFGFHGSCGYLPYGRGRSPLNWSIINGDTRFILNMFQYDEYADSPNVFKSQMFEITPFDTIRTLQYKNLIAACTMSADLLDQHKEGRISIQTNSRDPDVLYPKRRPEDGQINFLMKTREIYNLIRGVTKPFPGAFCFDSQGSGKVTIWDAIPFDQMMDFSDYTPGEIIAVFDNMPIVRTIDGSLMIKSYEASHALAQGDILRSQLA